MAKISAHGEYAIERVDFTRPRVSNDFGLDFTVEYVWVLTSGGRVLERAKITHSDESVTRSPYRLVARIPANVTATRQHLVKHLRRTGAVVQEDT